MEDSSPSLAARSSQQAYRKKLPVCMNPTSGDLRKEVDSAQMLNY